MHARLAGALRRSLMGGTLALASLVAACGKDDGTTDPPRAVELRTSATANVFDPPTLTITRGTPVSITLGATHNLDFEDPSIADLPTFGATGTRTFTTPGTYRYRCPEHSVDYGNGMIGTIVVQ